MAILKNIEWIDNSTNTIIHKFVDPKNQQINKGSALTVREGQNVVFVDKGRLADVFLPGFYKLDTNNMPVLTKLMSWKYGFETPFKSDVYFVSMKQFTNCKWGTLNPILLYDPDFGNINVRGYGSFSFKVDDAYVLLRELTSSSTSYKTENIIDYLKSLVITGITDAFGESDVPVSKFAGKIRELGAVVKKTLDDDFKQMGLTLTQFNVENFSFPDEVTKALNTAAAQGIELGAMRKNIDIHSQMRMSEAMVEAAKNPGTGGVMGAGMGMGMGVGMGNMFANMMGQNMGQQQQNQQQQPQQAQQVVKVKCARCGEINEPTAKFCHGCGNSMTVPMCPGCKKIVTQGTKFCPECGTKI